MVATPHRVGDWKLEDRGHDFLAWRRDLGGFDFNQRVAEVWVEDSATGEGYIAWVHVAPEPISSVSSVAIVDNGEEVPREEAIDRAMEWMRQNPRWPEHRESSHNLGLSGWR